MKRVGSPLPDTRPPKKPPQPGRVTRDQAHKPRLTEHHEQLFKSLQLSKKNGTWIDSSTFSINIHNGTLKLNFNQSGMLNYCEITYNLPTPRTYRSESIELIGNDFCLSGEGFIEFSSTQHPNTSIVLSGKFTNNNLEASEIHLNANGYKYLLPEDNYHINEQSQDPTIVKVQSKSGKSVTINLNNMTILSDESYPKFKIDPVNGILVNYSDKLIKTENENGIYFYYKKSEKKYYCLTYNKQTKEIYTGITTKQYELVEGYTFNPKKTIDELGENFHEGYRTPTETRSPTYLFTNVDNIDFDGDKLKFTGSDYEDPNRTKSFTHYFTNGQTLPH